MKRGFTLVELMIVIAVIAILATISLFGVQNAQKASRDTQRAQIMNGIRANLERYNGDKSSYPATNFTNMMFALTSAPAYMSAPSDPGGGAGTKAYVNTDKDANNNWVPSGVSASYSYTSGSGSYTLVLLKEGGGNLTFASPK